jgi:hypothetical protein
MNPVRSGYIPPMSRTTRISCIAAAGLLGSGFLETSLLRGVSLGVDFIGCDAGTVDNGSR